MSDRDAREELNDLLNGAVEVAAEMLEQEGEFEPFALALRKDGEIMHLSPDEEGEDEREPEQVVESLRKTLRESREDYRAVAVVADVTLEDENDQAMTAAIQVAMEHAAEEPVNCYVPYEFKGEALELAELVGEPGERVVFAGDRPN
ncbi:hypothetical protein [Sandaracinus amylolyticus]|uniref:Uncharacterized protein n=1 Tax=Sandaracinus amylolyticus TaxID=927083 RepID=A0A0F6YNC4_9BACT|nr:hypothetical protein [Sandaracinus amylolyticus]AKF11245.1 hypothetical protein DB32_008394 [Sandaracinus amylolyticus]